MGVPSPCQMIRTCCKIKKSCSAKYKVYSFPQKPLFPCPRWQLRSVRTDILKHLINYRSFPLFIARLSPAAVELRDEGLEAGAGLVLALILHHQGVALTRVTVTWEQFFIHNMTEKFN